MSVKAKIRKRIRTLEMLKRQSIDEIQISKEESENIGNIKYLDGVKLVVVEDKTKISVKRDCFAYIEKNEHVKCYCLEKLYCKKEICKFYRNDIEIAEIENSIKEYATSQMTKYTKKDL